MKEQNLDQVKAEEVVNRKDEAAANFIYDFFDADWNDPHHYHMILNTSRIAPEKCIEMILNAVKNL
mgnify:CR=1 FL=1